METGVYAIYHDYNPEKLYVGSTSVNFNTRFKVHLNKLRRNIHNNSHLQNVANKHGIEGFHFKVIEETLPENCLNSEQKWIDVLDVYNKGYNQSKIARNCVLSTRQKIRISKNRCKQVYKLDVEGNIIKQYNSINHASRKTNIPSSLISRCCILNKGSAGGYHWSFVKNYNKNIKRGNIRIRSPLYRDIFNIDLNNVLIY